MRGWVLSLAISALCWAGLALGEDPELPSDSTAEVSEPPVEVMSNRRWIQVSSRMEGASADIASAAREVQATAQEIEAAGRLSHLTRLSGLSTSLDHKVIQARLAADQLLIP
jgi:hypothetical protein